MHHLVLEAMVGTWCELIISKAQPHQLNFLFLANCQALATSNELNKTLKKNGFFTRKPTRKQIAPNNSLKPYSFH